MRYLFDFPLETLTTGALGPDATRDAAAIQTYLDGCAAVLDVDDNGVAEGDTDGVLLVRYLYGFRGQALIDGALGPDSERSEPEEIADYLAAHV